MKKKESVLFLTVLILAALVYYRVVINELNLTTGMIFLAAVCMLLFGVSEIAMSLLKRSENTKNNMRLLLITTSILLIGLELFLRFGLKKYPTYAERNGSRNYESLYGYESASWFHTFGDIQELNYSKPEFTHVRKVNSLGLAEQEIAVEKASNEYRIIALGDSFTEGVGASYDSTWVKIVEKNLTARIPDKKITTMNAGISGSDPYFEYMLFREKLLPFKPDLVIVATNHTDVNDVLIRGGMERFQSDGSMVSSRRAPNWEWAYGISYIFRHIIHDIFHYNWFLIRKRDMQSEQSKAGEKIKLVLNEFARLSQEHGFDLLVVFHPVDEYEAKNEEYAYGLNDLISGLSSKQDVIFIDLLDYYKVNHIMTTENASDFYWSIDGHHNTQGYEVMGNAIANKVIELNVIN